MSRFAAGSGRSHGEYSPQRTYRTAGIASAGSLLAILGIMTVGTSAQDSAGASAPATDAVGTVPAAGLVTVAPATVATPATAAPTTAAATCTNTYTVVPGDFWIRIAGGASLNLNDLLSLNHATKATPLFPGQLVCLPDGVSVAATVPRTTVAAPRVTAAPATTAPKAATHSSR